MRLLLVLFCIGMLFEHGCFRGDAKLAEADSNAPSETPRKNAADWQPATFRALVVGKSKRDESLEVFGKPTSSGSSSVDLPEDVISDEISDAYFSAEFNGELVVSSSKSTGVISGIVIYPTNTDLKTVEGKWAKGYVTTRYRHITCHQDAGSSAMEESPEGTIELIEYRSQGIVIDVDRPDGRIKTIKFVAGPVGGESPCKSNERL
jgi:hypothetical protein